MIPKRVTLEPLREERGWDLGFPVLCFLFLVSRVLDVYTLINVYLAVGRDTFNPLNHPWVQLVLGFPVNWVGDYDLSPLNMAALYHFGIEGLLLLHTIFVLIVLVFALLVWYGGNNFAKTLSKVAIYFFTLLSALAALLNIFFYRIITS